MHCREEPWSRGKTQWAKGTPVPWEGVGDGLERMSLSLVVVPEEGTVLLSGKETPGRGTAPSSECPTGSEERRGGERPDRGGGGGEARWRGEAPRRT